MKKAPIADRKKYIRSFAISRALGLAPALLLLGSALFSHSAQADIVLIDLNAAYPEILAAQKAADARGEKLWVIPSIPNATRQKVAALDRKVHVLQRRLKDLRKQRDQTKNPSKREQLSKTLDQLQTETQAIQAQSDQLTKPHTLTAAALKTELTRIQESGSSVNSLIFSGHSNGNDFSGSLGKLNESEIRAFVTQNEKLQESLTGLYLWGCYTGTKATTVHWKSNLKNVDVVIGFHKQAPTDMTEASPDLLEAALRNEAELAQSKSMESAKEILQSLEHARSFPIAALVNDCYVGTKVPSVKISESEISCAAETQTFIQNYTHVYIANFYGLTPTGDIETGRNSPLRHFYAHYQANRHCPTVRRADLSPQKIISLIHSKEVVENFAELYAPELEALIQKISRLPEKAKLALLLEKVAKKTANRKDVFSLEAELASLSLERKFPKTIVSELLNGAQTESTLLTEADFQTIDLIRKHVFNLDCIPLSWVESPIPGVTPASPSCETN